MTKTYPRLSDTVFLYITPEADRLINAYLKTRAFEPAFAWKQTFDISPDMLTPWPALANWMPPGIEGLLTWLQTKIQESK